MEAAKQSLRRDLLTPGGVTWLVAILPLVLGALVVWSYVRFVREADELQRAVQLNALSVSFGVTVVASLADPALQLVGAPAIPFNLFTALGVLLYLGGVSLGTWRYR